MRQGGFVRIPLVKIDRPAQAHQAVGAVGALDHQGNGGGLHLGDHIVVGTVELGDVLGLFGHAGAVEKRVTGHVGAGDDAGAAAGRLVGVALAVDAGAF